MDVQRVVGALVVALTLLATACGGSDDSATSEGTGFDSVMSEISGLSGPKRQARLVELAKKEGGLSLYTSYNSDIADALTSAFGDAYDIDAAVYRAGGETVLPRLIEEAKAGFHGADVVDVNGLAMATLENEGLLVPYRSPEEKELIPGSVFPGWDAANYQSFVVSWNSKLVSGSERPTTWEALADPRWKGRLAMEASDVDWYVSLRNYWIAVEGKSEAEADRLFEAMARNALVVNGHTFMGQLMSAGEVTVGTNYLNRVESYMDEGAPLAWQPPVEPIFAEPQGVGLVRGARHPAAAILFMDWLLRDGQKILTDNGLEAARKDLVVAPNAERRVIDVAAIEPDVKTWTDRYDKLLQLGKTAKQS